MIRARILILAVPLIAAGLPTPSFSAETAAATHFRFTPPSQSPEFRDMVIGITTPQPSGSLFGENAQTDPVSRALLRAGEHDLRKIILAKGFRVSGIDLMRDKLSDRQKDAMSLLLEPKFALDLVLTPKANGGTEAIVTGKVTLYFTEPDTGARVWNKEIELRSYAAPLGGNTVAQANFVAGNAPRLRGATEARLLNDFYPVMLRQIWDQFDPLALRTLAIKMIPD